MLRYRVEHAPATIGAGALLGLSDDQIAVRAHRVQVVEQHPDFSVVKALEPLDFKIGEVIRLDQVDRYLEGILVALDAPEPETESDRSDAMEEVAYEAMKRDELNALADRRGIDTSAAKNKGDVVALLKRADVVDAAIAARDYDVLTIEELHWLAEQRDIELGDDVERDAAIAAIVAADAESAS